MTSVVNLPLVSTTPENIPQMYVHKDSPRANLNRGSFKEQDPVAVDHSPPKGAR
jgi:hypothetical protein